MDHNGYDKIPHWTRYTRLNRFFNLTDLAREHIALERQQEKDLSAEIERLWS